jgi:putative transposase
MKAHQAEHSIPALGRVLGVSPSGYYAWVHRRPSRRATQDGALIARIKAFHQASRGTYGTPRIHRDLRAAGIRVGRKRVARLLQQAGLRGVSRRKWVRTTVRSDTGRPAPDLVQRQFVASAPNQLWVADITYIPTWAGMLYLAVVLDVWSRRVIGWAMETHLRTALVLAALNMAVDQRRPQQVIHHSDQGCQYTAVGFGLRCRAAGVRPSMGSVGDCYDNALCESFFATLECELLDRVTLHTPREARGVVFDFIEGWYNPTRRHSALDYESPIAFERQHATHPGGGVDAQTERERRPVEAAGAVDAQTASTAPWKPQTGFHELPQGPSCPID